MPHLNSLSKALLTIFHLWWDFLSFIRLSLRPRSALAAENLFLRKQLALYLERQIKPRRATVATRLTLVLLSKLFAWREAVTIVTPDTLIRWLRQGFGLLWRWKSKLRGRPPVPAELQKLIVEVASENATWGEERIANELLLKLGIRISLGPSDAICHPTKDRRAAVVRKNIIRPHAAISSSQYSWCSPPRTELRRDSMTARKSVTGKFPARNFTATPPGLLQYWMGHAGEGMCSWH